MSLLQWSSHAHPVTERSPSEACKSVNRCQGTESLQCQENNPIACLACSLIPRPIHMVWEWGWSCLLYPVSLIAFTTCYEYGKMGGSRLAYITCLQAPPLKLRWTVGTATGTHLEIHSSCKVQCSWRPFILTYLGEWFSGYVGKFSKLCGIDFPYGCIGGVSLICSCIWDLCKSIWYLCVHSHGTV